MRHLFLICVMLSFINDVRGQYSDSDMALGKAYYKGIENYQSPGAASLGTFGSTPVSLFTGVPDISIPLYDLKLDKLKIPISLRYHIHNAKPNIHPGVVGLGWSLHCGGSITRIQHSYQDEQERIGLVHSPGFLTDNWFNLFPYDGMYNEYKFGAWDSAHRLDMEAVIQTAKKAYQDIEPDEFNFNFLGYSGSFYLDHTGNWKVRSETKFKISHELIGYNKTRIAAKLLASKHEKWTQDELSQCPTFHKFSLVSPEGITFIFGGINAIDYSCEYYDQSTQRLKSRLPVSTTWYLSSIIAPNNEKVEFEYIPVDPVIDANLGFSQQSNFFHIGCGRVLNIQLVLPVLLRTIKFNEKDLVTFRYKNTVELGYPTKFFQDWEQPFPLDIEKPYAPVYAASLSGIKWQQLESISILDQIKYELKYTNSFNERLKLVGLEKKSLNYNGTDQKYQFIYNADVKLPNYLSGFYDHLGFYNGKDFSFYFKYDFHEQKTANSSLYNRSIVFKNARQADTTGKYATAEMLKSIVYPTGGKTTFEFEPNKVKGYLSVDRQTVINNEFYPGGVRLKKTTNYDANGQIINSKSYHYVHNFNPKVPSGKSSGILSFTPEYYEKIQIKRRAPFPSNDTGIYGYREIEIFESKATNAGWFNTQGVFVGYSEVTEIEYDANGQNTNGYTRHTFTNFDTDIWGNTHFDDPPVVFLNNPQNLKYPVFRNTPFCSKDMERGKKTSELTYDSNNTLVKSVYNKYIKLSSDPIRAINVFISPPTNLLSDFSENAFGGAYYIYTYDYLVNNIETILNVQNIKTGISYEFNENCMVTKETKKNSMGKDITTIYTYPPQATALYKGHMLSTIIKEENKVGDIWTGVTKINYPDNSVNPGSIDVSFRDNTKLSKKILFDIYDNNGNLIQFTTEDGVPTTYLRGYNNLYVIAEINNATYDQIERILTKSFINRISGQSEPSSSDISKIEGLRGAPADFRVSTFKYKPFIGILEHKGPSDITTYYDYDSFGRLKRTYIKEGTTEKTIQSYDYHYQKQ